ncbi:hypothetical protein CLU79DRAFT_767923 [Phycomyces nitens]|nr:hypothetical protein CLU79DRAFT_767923 [Phycomyces nitens]
MGGLWSARLIEFLVAVPLVLAERVDCGFGAVGQGEQVDDRLLFSEEDVCGRGGVFHDTCLDSGLMSVDWRIGWRGGTAHRDAGGNAFVNSGNTLVAGKEVSSEAAMVVLVFWVVEDWPDETE